MAYSGKGSICVPLGSVTVPTSVRLVTTLKLTSQSPSQPALVTTKVSSANAGQLSKVHCPVEFVAENSAFVFCNHV